MRVIIYRFFNLMGDYKKNFYKSIFFAILKILFEALQIIALYLALKDVFTDSVGIHTVLRSLIIIIISIVGASFTQGFSELEKTKCGYKGGAIARIKIAEHLKSVAMGYFNNRSLGYMSAIATNTVQNIQEIGTMIVFFLVNGVLSSLFIFLGLLFFNYKLGIIAFVGMSVFFLTISWMQKRSELNTDKYSKAENDIVSAVIEFIQGLPAIKSYNRQRVETDTLQKSIKKHSSLLYIMEKDSIPVAFTQKLVLNLTALVIAFVSLIMAINGEIQIYEMLTIMVSVWLMFLPLEIAGSFVFLVKMLGNSELQIEDILNMPTMNESSVENIPDENNIEFNNVDFSYSDKKILKNISFKVADNTTTAIIGPSGSGKTTISNLIARFFDVNNGSVKIGGKDVREYSLYELMSKISIVFQDVYLFNDTIANNIRFGKPNATMEEVIKAAKDACCDEFIDKLPNGYDTMVGERGVNLSGGEKQRLSIARCLLKDSPIILLDEATANIDPENEDKIKNAIESLLHKKTVVMIAHRINTVQKADQIIAIDNGEIKQIGNHNELLNQEGIYKDFINSRIEAIHWKI